MECLKKKSVDELLGVRLPANQYLSTWGPIVDGIVVPHHPEQLMELMAYGSSGKAASKNGQTSGSVPFGANFNGDLLLGLTRVEVPNFVFSPNDQRFGIDLNRRNRILRTLVRNLFDYHQQVGSCLDLCF